MPVIYDNKKLIPVQNLSLEKQIDRTEDGIILGSKWNIVINGVLIAYKGSPNSNGIFWDQPGYPPDEVLSQDQRLTAIIRKQEAIRGLFANEGKTLEIQGFDGMQPMKCNPRLVGIRFQEGIWVETCEYNITLETDIIYINGLPFGEDNPTHLLSNISESWSIEQGETPQVYRLSHNISATGKRSYGPNGELISDGWEQARQWVQTKLGIDVNKAISSGVLNLPGYMSAFNYLRSENINEIGGEVSVTESWVISSGMAYEEFTIEGRVNEEGRTTASVQGTVNGLEIRNNTTYELIQDRYTSANLYFNNVVNDALLSRAQTYLGTTFNPTPINKSVGHNVIAGVINYAIEYDDRPSSNIPGAKSEIITLEYNNPVDLLAKIPVIGRASGPVIQSLGTITERTQSLNIELVMDSASQSFSPTKPNTDNIVSLYQPSSSQYSIIKIEEDRESWNPINGRFSRSIRWLLQ